jgi:hypothetical protein
MATDDTRPPYDDLAAIIRRIAATEDYDATWVSDWNGRPYCKYCDKEEPEHEPDCVLMWSRVLAARLPPG